MKCANGPKILYVEDDPTLRRGVEYLLNSLGYTVTTAVDGLQAWTLLQQEVFHLVITDYEMPRMDGAELVRRIHEGFKDLPVVMTTGSIGRHAELKSLRPMLVAVLFKPYPGEELFDAVTRALWGSAGTRTAEPEPAHQQISVARVESSERLAKPILVAAESGAESFGSAGSAYESGQN